MEGALMGFMTNVMPYGRRERDLIHHTVVEAPPRTDIFIDVNEALDEGQRDKVVTALKKIEGVLSAEFTPQQWHLLIVWYDPHCTSSRAIIEQLRLQDVHAQLIGPL
jgi:hypothetical protein